jgi:hypothetical protein
MAKVLPDIIFSTEKNTPIIDAKTSFYNIPYYKNIEYFSNYESYVNFIKGCEKLVRQNDRYSKYIRYLKKEIKLDRCQVLKNITDEDASIEMHHGPIFNLFDYCAIVLEYFILKKWKITTARIADVVLDEHQKNRIQVVMVSASVHEQIHAGNIFINYHQAYGNLKEFIDKYGIAITDEYREQLNRYIDRSLLYDSNDFGVLELNKNLI